MVDDICDGVIVGTLTGAGPSGMDLTAFARVVAAPPDYAPDRRPIVSLADGLKNRVDRAEVAAPEYFADPALCDQEIAELMQRVCETSANSNLEEWNGARR